MAGEARDFTATPFNEGELDIAGEPYSVSVLKVGYCRPQPDGSFQADGTISLLTGPKTILVDTGGPWDRRFLIAALQDKGQQPEDVDFVVGTHGHSDHIGNLNVFPNATIVVGCDVSVVPTPGHTGNDVSVQVRGTSAGTVVIAGDLFECCADEGSWQKLSENPAVQEVSRQRIWSTADVIIPGHGLPFRVQR
ncbi:metallo-beta-lactamase domain-containing protein 1 isoform X2 [Lampris incognitus]|uniref:metallo-beta-lactamase domain-containing protein 1 isoform X2 n=1 Tax=Lampris incognitus TaxID=2546036 RepID=UPI0024B607DD|nr:metallo-beta-lactamase domain-containing protein 1 isoform X2 [Lampris incognitus]